MEGSNAYFKSIYTSSNARSVFISIHPSIYLSTFIHLPTYLLTNVYLNIFLCVIHLFYEQQIKEHLGGIQMGGNNEQLIPVSRVSSYAYIHVHVSHARAQMSAYICAHVLLLKPEVDSARLCATLPPLCRYFDAARRWVCMAVRFAALCCMAAF